MGGEGKGALEERWERYRRSIDEVWGEVTAHIRANSLNAARRTLSENEVCVLQYIEEKLARRMSAAERRIAQIAWSTGEKGTGGKEVAAEHERYVESMERELDSVLMLYGRAVGPSLWPERELVPLSEHERELIFGCVSDERVKGIVSYLLGLSAKAPPALPEPSEIGPDIVNECIVCMSRERTHVFVPCMHFLLCEVCTLGVAKCPTCFFFFFGKQFH